MPRSNSKRSRALDQLTIAQDALAKALTLLGGRPRGLPRKVPAPRDWQARSFIISCINRLDTVQYYLTDFIISIKPDPNPPVLRDDFEREYDKTRNPSC